MEENDYERDDLVYSLIGIWNKVKMASSSKTHHFSSDTLPLSSLKGFSLNVFLLGFYLQNWFLFF